MLVETSASQTGKISFSVTVGNQEKSRNHLMLLKRTEFDIFDTCTW